MKALIVGASGLVGSETLKLLNNDESITKVVSLGRSKEGQEGKVQHLKVDFENLAETPLEEDFDLAFCCLGITIKKAGSQENFKKVDLDYVLTFADLAKSKNVKTFAVVSAMGADIKSSFFYNRVKGEMEQNIAEKGFYGTVILRPSLLLGKRKEFRFGEKTGELLLTIFRPIMIGSWRSYTAIKATDVTYTMVSSSKKQPKGIRIFKSAQIRAYAKNQL